ncbi:MAG: hypothetical protein J3R72DRAFT_440804, partial [Linnemannia gamsii]
MALPPVSSRHLLQSKGSFTTFLFFFLLTCRNLTLFLPPPYHLDMVDFPLPFIFFKNIKGTPKGSFHSTKPLLLILPFPKYLFNMAIMHKSQPKSKSNSMFRKSTTTLLLIITTTILVLLVLAPSSLVQAAPASDTSPNKPKVTSPKTGSWENPAPVQY